MTEVLLWIATNFSVILTSVGIVSATGFIIFVAINSKQQGINEQKMNEEHEALQNMSLAQRNEDAYKNDPELRKKIDERFQK